jgi:carbamoyltransferase
MNIIGINGLGINPAACVLRDGELKAFAAEERFTRIKDSFGLMPSMATQWCLEQAELDTSSVDAIAFGWNANLYRFYMPLFVAFSALRFASFKGDKGAFPRVVEQLTKYHPKSVRKSLFPILGEGGSEKEMPPVFYYSHHLAHAASTFYSSGFEQSLVFVVDGSGENLCTSVYEGSGENLKKIFSLPIPHSLGWFYQSITEWLGFTPNSHEGKTMALAAYGKPDPALFMALEKMLRLRPDGEYRYNPVYSFAGRHSKGKIFSDQLESLLGRCRLKGEPFLALHYDVAFATQQLIENAMLAMVEKLMAKPGFSGNLCLAGGVSLNCKMNGVLASHKQVNKIFVPPVSSDDGTALGAALLLAKERGYNVRSQLEHAYWGPSFDNVRIEEELKKAGLTYFYREDIVSFAAEALKEGKIIGWFQGAMEVGARALGNRSILAHPGLPKMKDRVNLRVKNREAWRPFAASILFEAAERMVHNPKPSPFMTIAFSTTEEAKKLIPEAIHIDGTTRPQFVTLANNRIFYQLIKEFERLTGIPALLNTSFNDQEEPIVCRPEQAIQTFLNTGLEVLVLGNFYVIK